MSLVKTTFEENEKIATLTLNRPPVNSLNLELNQAISSAIKEIESQHPKTQALLFKSSNPKILSAGLDILELYQPKDRSHLEQFWRSVQQVFIDLYSSRLATIAVIQGHAPAGGCMLAMACDYRIMASKDDEGNTAGTIGLSETKLGIVAPHWLAEAMVNTIGFRQAEKSMGLGILYTPEQALEIGLVDEVVESKDDVDKKALNVAAKWVKIPSEARYASKMTSRGTFLKKMEEERENDLESFCRFVLSDNVQNSLGSYLLSLKKS